MSKVNFHVLNESIVLNFKGNTEVISASDRRYDRIIASIKAGTLDDDIEELTALKKSFEGTGLELRDGNLFDGETMLPTALTDRIVKFRDMGLPYGPLLSFWGNLRDNPSFNSRQMLYKFLENNGHPLTDDGCFIAYRGVGEDFKDKRTGSFDNSPGQILEMPRDQVDDNPNNTCSSGFHVACFEYASGFGPKLLEVKVNPADVVAVPTDYNGTKMRVCKFEVIAEAQQSKEEKTYQIRKEEVYGKPETIYADESDDDSDDEYGIDDDEYCIDCGSERNPFANFCGQCGHEH